MKHQWTGYREPNTANGPGESYVACVECGTERNDDNRDEVCMTAIPTDEEVARYLDALPWSDKATEDERALVAGNIRSFVAWLRRGMVDCATCEDTGEVTHEYGSPVDIEPTQVTEPCPDCGGNFP